MTEIDVSGCCLYKDGICLTDKGKCTSMCDYGAYAREEKLKRLEQKLEKIKEITTKYSQHEGYLLDGLFTDLVDELSEVLKDE